MKYPVYQSLLLFSVFKIILLEKQDNNQNTLTLSTSNRGVFKMS